MSERCSPFPLGSISRTWPTTGKASSFANSGDTSAWPPVPVSIRNRNGPRPFTITETCGLSRINSRGDENAAGFTATDGDACKGFCAAAFLEQTNHEQANNRSTETNPVAKLNATLPGEGMAFSFRAYSTRCGPKTHSDSTSNSLRVAHLSCGNGSASRQGGPALQWTGMPTTLRSHAKINLGLGIGAPRDDGFHALGTVYQTIELHDLVTVSAQ